ncbi:MAG: helix-turn-helix domain-containing protein [Clostridia bacterium]|nr:helix-turn-helix domain-containing protein [Clostridia bacterium]
MRDYSFGNFLHELRSRRGLTQYQLGALVGVSDKAVSKWENGSSKPQINILYKLSDILGVSVDELLTCKYHSSEKKDTKGVFAMKKQLWDKAFDTMRERYGNPTPLEILNRLLTEQAEMQNTDMIVYFNLLAVLSSEAKKQGEYIRVRGGTGASFVAYLLGAIEICPLKPHYYCPECCTVIFDNSVDDGWDLPEKICSCGKEMQIDGHNIPFETYRHVVHRNTSFDVSMSPNFWRIANSVIKEYFKDCELTATEREENRIITYTVTSDKSACAFTFLADTEFEQYQALERATGTAFERVNFSQNAVLNEFKLGNTDGIPEFRTNFYKDMAEEATPNSFYDLVQISGLSHGTGVWIGNAKELVNQGIPVRTVIAYRDDVFNHIAQHMLRKGIANTGYAYKIMEDTRKGVYFRGGISDEMKKQLKDIEIEDWFIDSIGKIQYLFPKAHGVTYVKLAATLMWYKMHYPKEFNETML